MQKIQKIHRGEYIGEDVVTSMTYSQGQWQYETEYIANQVENNQVSNRAIVIGNGTSRKTFDLAHIARHKNGVGVHGALQSYGCNALYREFTPSFLVANGDVIVKEIAESGYCTNNIVYANATSIVKYPGKFYLIPQDPSWNAGSIATYMACFDGHSTVYLMGFDGMDHYSTDYNVYSGTNGYTSVPTHGHNEDFWTQSMALVFNTYNDVDFVRVTPTPNFRMPDEWKYIVNLRQITFNEFILEADL